MAQLTLRRFYKDVGEQRLTRVAILGRVEFDLPFYTKVLKSERVKSGELVHTARQDGPHAFSTCAEAQSYLEEMISSILDDGFVEAHPGGDV